MKDILKVFKQIYESITKPFEGFWKELGKEIPWFLLGIALEGGKNLGWRGNLFVWPFIVAFVIGAAMLILPLLVFLFKFLF